MPTPIVIPPDPATFGIVALHCGRFILEAVGSEVWAIAAVVTG